MTHIVIVRPRAQVSPTAALGLLLLAACGGDDATLDSSDGGRGGAHDIPRGVRTEDSADAALDAATTTDGGSADGSYADGGPAAAQGDARVLADSEGVTVVTTTLPEGGTLPSWIEPLLGVYAKRSVHFGFDQVLQIVTMSLDLALVTISADEAGNIDASTQLCALSTLWNGGSPSFTLLSPSSVVPMRQRIALGTSPSHVSSGTGSMRMGFDPARQERCSALAPGALVAKYPDQTWIIGPSCQCPDNAALLPLSRDDCRVSDLDGDGQPGATLVGSGALVPPSVAIAVDYAYTFTEGEVRTDRAHRVTEKQLRSAACLNAAIDGCSLGDSRACMVGETLLRPLAASATCADVKREAGQSFPPLPEFPAADCSGAP